ncbi:hypothetical protein [Aestuariibaculum sediminum]|uniref:Uncharacterized protein n=1 Tax=Aestuariibaculum sediminum TaxID=2770637 RepID=A0A8J6PYI9_9FLAO|nr:hypothetical protein [Aestuariibaculum sediminum]MBD0831097.1 hypothetical protein [Aestuariibaculum sediminum]
MNKSFDLKRNGSIIIYESHLRLFLKWKLELHKDYISIGKKSYKTNTVEKLVFEVDGRSHSKNPFGPTLCVSKTYLKLKDKRTYVHFFTIEVEENYVLCNQSECYKITENLLKEIKEKYNIPFEYSLGGDTEEKDLTTTLVLVLVPLIWILIYLLSK